VIKEFNLVSAQKKSYEAINKINFEGMYYRKDIAEKAFKHLT
jgi:phosphoribosylamine-glycine ligase